MAKQTRRWDRTRFWAVVLACLLLFGVLIPCAGAQPSKQTKISLWTYPIGAFGNPDVVNQFIAAFQQKYPEIQVTVDYLNYDSGDDQISAALAAGTAPDVVMEGPERIVANWGAKGVMADLSDLWTEDAIRDFSAESDLVVKACKNQEGIYYEYPLCQTAHCMAINYEVFQKAGALPYLDLENRTWTTENFIKACRAVADSGLVDTPGVIYCGGQGGDQGTRALVSNLYGASFTNINHTAYTINSAQGIQALTTLKTMTESGLLRCDADIQASDELALFAEGSTAMSFAWNSSNEKNYASQVKFTPYAMAFPTNQASPSLCSGIWGFGVFNNGDSERIAAAKTFLRFLCDDETQGKESVRATNLFPVRASFGDVYAGTKDEERMKNYQGMLRYAGDYNNVTPGWAAQRTVWWNMLQQVFSGTNPKDAADWYAKAANQAIDSVGQKPVAGISEQQTKRALFISSYSLSDPTVKEQIEGIQEGLGNSIYLHMEFMDSRALSDEEYVAAFYQYIRYKYAHLSGLGAIIVGDDNALQMVIRYQNDFFRNIPVIYESVNSQSMTELANSLGMIGIPTKDTIRDNLDLAWKIRPKATKILAISDNSAVGATLTAHLEAIQSRYAPLTVEILNTSTYTLNEISNKIEKAGTDTILLYLCFTADVYGKAYPNKQALELVVDHAKSPVFTLSRMEEGSLGGIAADSKEIGKQAGALTLCYLKETLPDKAASESQVPTTASFDASVMERFGLRKKVFPQGSVYYNNTNGNRRLIAAIVALAGALFLLTVLLIRYRRENRRREQNENQLQQTSAILRSEAELDELTGVGNRRLFDRELVRSAAANRHFALFLLDVDDFKRINDTYGHLTGDLVLQETGNRLNTIKSRVLVPYRYGGDEFAVMAFMDQPEELLETREQIALLFRKAISSGGREIQIQVSVGSARFPEDGATPEALIYSADQALYAAKADRKSRGWTR